MTAAIADRLRLSYDEETTFGVLPGTKSSITLTLSVNPTASDQMTIGSVTYTFVSSIGSANQILIGGSVSDTQNNIVNAIKRISDEGDDLGTPGTDYGTGTVQHPQVTISAFNSSNVATITAHTPGTAGDSIASTETFTSGSNVFSGATLSGGADAVYTDVRLTSESLKQTTETVTSNEIRSDRQITDVVRTNISGGGDVAFELSYGAHDDLLQAALYDSAWSAAHSEITSQTTISFNTADNSINDSGNGFTGGTDDYTVNSWIRISDADNTANNGFAKIVSVTAGSIVVSHKTFVAETAGASITITQMGDIINGTTLKTYTLEKEWTDLSNVFETLSGMAVSTLSLTVPSDGIVIGTFGFIGKEAVTAKYTSASSKTAAATNNVMNSIDNVVSILEETEAYPSTEFSLSLTNNIRTRSQIATLGAASLGSGRVNVTGTIQAFLSNSEAIAKYLNFTETSIAVIFQDSGGNTYIVDCPRVKFTDGQRVAGGTNSDVIANLTFTAYRHVAQDYTIKIARVAG